MASGLIVELRHTVDKLLDGEVTRFLVNEEKNGEYMYNGSAIPFPDASPRKVLDRCYLSVGLRICFSD